MALTDMTGTEFQAAYSAAPRYDNPDAYAAEFGDKARSLWNVACLPFRDFLALTGYTRAGLARRFCIPLITLDQWLSGKRNPPPYVRLLLAECTGIISREE